MRSNLFTARWASVRRLVGLCATLLIGLGLPLQGPAVAAAPVRQAAEEPAATQLGPSMQLLVGKSTLLRLPNPVERLSVGNPGVADMTLINARELYLLGKSSGSTNLILWDKGGQATIVDLTVRIDLAPLRDRLALFMPEEKAIRVDNAGDSIVLSGTVSSAPKVDRALEITNAFIAPFKREQGLAARAGATTGGAGGTAVNVGGAQGRKTDISSEVVNLLKVSDPQQVMLEVKIAEVQKGLLDKLGVALDQSVTTGDLVYRLINRSKFLDPPVLGAAGAIGGDGALWVDAEKEDTLIKILAEPNIIAISGQEGSFLAGGKIFIPVARQESATGVPTITLEEKEFGVGLKFTPTVLEGGRIHLKVAPEVSELQSEGSPIISGTVTTVLPSFTTRRAQTTVQLNDGQSFAIAGLIKNNVREKINRFPWLGELPILGALFRSSSFQSDKTELLFVVTPRLVKPLPAGYTLPTDSFREPSRKEFFLEGKMEGQAPQPGPAPIAQPAGGGFEMR